MMETNFIGKSSAVKKLLREIPRLAGLQKPLLLVGPTGVGKTTLSSLIHAQAKRAGKPLILNPVSSTESELKDAFEKQPKHDSTIVFQDIEAFSFLYQAKISHFLRSLTSKSPFQVILIAKNDVSGSNKQGKMLDDLHVSLRKCEVVNIPPLSERTEDIPLLVEHFIQATCKSMDTELKSIDINALDFLVRREWKENISELKSVIESAVLTSKEESIELPDRLVNEYLQLEGIVKSIDEKKAFLFDKSLYNLEKTLIERTLEVVGDNQTRASEILNISEANLRYRLKKFHILASRKK